MGEHMEPDDEQSQSQARERQGGDMTTLNEMARSITICRLRARSLLSADISLQDELLDALALAEINVLRLIEEQQDVAADDSADNVQTQN